MINDYMLSQTVLALVQEWCVLLHPMPPMALSAMTQQSLALWLPTVAIMDTFSWDMERLSAAAEPGGATLHQLANVSPTNRSYLCMASKRGGRWGGGGGGGEGSPPNLRLCFHETWLRRLPVNAAFSQRLVNLKNRVEINLNHIVVCINAS